MKSVAAYNLIPKDVCQRTRTAAVVCFQILSTRLLCYGNTANLSNKARSLQKQHPLQKAVPICMLIAAGDAAKVPDLPSYLAGRTCPITHQSRRPYFGGTILAWAIQNHVTGAAHLVGSGCLQAVDGCVALLAAAQLLFFAAFALGLNSRHLGLVLCLHPPRRLRLSQSQITSYFQVGVKVPYWSL